MLSIPLVCLTLISKNTQLASADVQHNHQGHKHEKIVIPPGQPVPSVDVVVRPDAMKGWNLEVKVSNFKFAPENINTPPQPGEGHGHLYINGKKITRIYGSWYYINNLPPGKNRITVSLNANNHANFVYNGKVIEDTEIVEIAREKGRR